MTEQKRHATYREDGWKATVEVLEDNSDDEKERYKLRVVETHRKSRLHGAPPDGTEFEASKLRGHPMAGLAFDLTMHE